MHSEILHLPRIWILALASSLGSVLAILFTPALPMLADYFQVSEQTMNASMTLYLLGYAVGALFYGPVSNRWGRKKALFMGCLLAFAATLFSLWMGMLQYFGMFCFARLIQGAGAAGGLKVPLTMIADTHSKESASRAYSYMMLAAILLPALALGIGGSLVSSVGWVGCLIFMSFYCLLLVFLIYFLPETAKEIDAAALHFEKVVHRYKKQFTDSFLLLHALMLGLCSSCYFFYAAQGPYLGIEVMGLTPQAYGWLSWIPMLGMAGGCVIAAHLKQPPRITMISGLILALTSLLVMLVCFINGFVTVGSFFILMAFVQMGIYVIGPTALSVALNEATDKSNASAVSQFINLGVAFAAIYVLGLFPLRAPIVLPALIGAALVGMLAIWLKLKAHHQKIS